MFPSFAITITSALPIWSCSFTVFGTRAALPLLLDLEILVYVITECFVQSFLSVLILSNKGMESCNDSVVIPPSPTPDKSLVKLRITLYQS